MDYKKLIKEAERIVKESGVSKEFAPNAFSIVLKHLMKANKNTNPISNEKTPNKLKWDILVEDKKPEGIYQIIALAVYFLGKWKKENGEKDESVSKQEIEKLFAATSYKHMIRSDIENLNRRINDSVSNYGLITSKGKRGYYTLTPLGQKAINELPKQLPQKKKAKKRKK